MTRARLFLLEVLATLILGAALAWGLRPVLVTLSPAGWLAVVLPVAVLLSLAVVVTGEHVYAAGGAR